MSCDNHPCTNLEIVESDEMYHRETKQYPKLKNALKIYNVEKEFKKASNLLEPMAYRGCAIAQYKIAALYDMGWGVEQDTNKAVFWYLQSANQGHPYALHNLATKYAKGEGVVKDHKKSLEYFCKAAEQGIPSAITMVGDSYMNGFAGIRTNHRKAEKLLLIAAEKGETWAMYKLAIIARKRKELKNAIEWYLKAADLGMVKAQYDLASLYDSIYGDDKESLKWYLKAANNGHATSQGWLATAYADGYMNLKIDLKKSKYWRSKQLETRLKEIGGTKVKTPQGFSKW